MSPSYPFPSPNKAPVTLVKYSLMIQFHQEAWLFLKKEERTNVPRNKKNEWTAEVIPKVSRVPDRDVYIPKEQM